MPRTIQPRRLDNHLTLHSYFNSLFGYSSTRQLLNDLKDTEEGFNPNGHSALCDALMGRSEIDADIREKLPIYDANIKRHLAAINDTRTQPIVLRYFQHLSLLYTEIFLDGKCNSPAEFLHRLNGFVRRRNDATAPSDPQESLFAAEDLEKLAFWMATGAGKTLIMHINYHQYLHYYKDPLDHIVLITPNEGLSEQHLASLADSGISARRFTVDGNRYRADAPVQVIEITKLVEERTSEGESVEVEAFEGRNLIFVDEGHKGSGGEVWRKMREALGETGFTFEYSATFGQALAAAKNAGLVEEYGKAIVFDYSYRHFYGDGYGKNFRILNIREDEETQTETLFLANLLSFYEQRRYFKGNAEAVRDYGLESPLWAFIGSKVNAVYTEKRRERSDVLNVILFLHRFLKNEGGWATDALSKVLDRESGLTDENGTDIFANRFEYLRTFNETAEDIYRDILNEVFRTDASGALHLQESRNAQGEIALKTTYGREVFGLIYIGDTSKFKKLVEKQDTNDIVVEAEEVLTGSRFSDINAPDSPINILIGAKKFIEGWDSWRVTAMGLLNIGRQEGSQIIQLFGRGVRLRGKAMSLKRSSALRGEHPVHISLLETLNIFAVRANFMTQFRDYLLREGVEPDEPVQLTIEIKRKYEARERQLFVPRFPSYTEGAKGQCERLQLLSGPIVTHTTQKVDIVGSSTAQGVHKDSAEGTVSTYIPETSLALVDWEKIYLQLIAYKHEKGYSNLIFNTATLREILNPNRPFYKLTVMDEDEVVPTSIEELERLETLVLTLLQKYITKYYRIVQKNWSSDRIQPGRLGETEADKDNFPDWTVYVPRTEVKEVQPQIKHLLETESMYGSELKVLPNIYSERHLYQPLFTNEGHFYKTLHNLGMANNLWRTTPPALEDSEKDFVGDLNRYLAAHPEEYRNRKQVFLLRNQSRGKGIGFYEDQGFYPDFILWITEGAKQRIVFIEPHGMIHEDISEDNPKLILFKKLRQISCERLRGEHVQMDAYVISRTSLTDLLAFPSCQGEDKSTFREKWHVLFREGDVPAYLDPIFQEYTEP